MGKCSGELGREGKVSLLVRGERSSGVGNCSDQRFVINEGGEYATFKEKMEVTDSQVSG
jgi:hypothetical protein